MAKGGGERGDTHARGGKAGRQRGGRSGGQRRGGGDLGRRGGQGGQGGRDGLERCPHTEDWLAREGGGQRDGTRDGADAGSGVGSARGGGGEVVPLYGWHGPHGPESGAVMDAHVAGVARATPRGLGDQIEALSWAIRCCERLARDAADEAERCASLTGNDRRVAAAELMADRVRALRWLRQTLEVADKPDADLATRFAAAVECDRLRALLARSGG